MAYLDDTFAVLPFGCSCQTNQQINLCAETISSSLNAKQYRVISTYFDWLISPSRSIERLVRDDLPIPSSENEILWHRGRPEFAGYGSLFYHEFLVDGQYVNTKDGFDSLRSKFTHTREILNSVVKDRIPIFVWSNTQNNLRIAARESDGLDLMLTPDVAQRIMAAGDRLSGKSANYIFVTYPDRHEMLDFIDPRANVNVIEPDESKWIGDRKQWEAVFVNLQSMLTKSG